MASPRIVVAGATGNLGHRIVKSLRARNAEVVALTRASSSAEKVSVLRGLGAEVAVVRPESAEEIAKVCEGASCVVSALLGMRETLVDAQSVLLEGAVKAGVPRFFPSDYAMDFTKLEPGSNRNLDLHREFLERLYRAPIAPTSILNGCFMELLLGQAPFILFKLKRTLYWGSPDVPLDFTTLDNTAEFTAAAAMERDTPRLLGCVGERISSRGLAEAASAVTGMKFEPQWAGTLGTLGAMIKVMKVLMPARTDPFPPWQGMQYSLNMFEGNGLVDPVENGRYPEIRWTSVRELLATRR